MPRIGSTLINSGNQKDNILINSGARISQRSTFTGGPSAVNATYWIDRWLTNFTGFAVNRQTIAAGSPIPGTRIARMISATFGANLGFMSHEQRVENTLSEYNGKQMVLSGYMRSNNSNARFRVSDGVNSYQGDPIPSDGQFYYVQFPFTVDAAATSVIFCEATLYDNGNVIVNSNDYIDFVGMKLEHGTVASPMTLRSIEEELALCQRYYEKSYNIDVAPGTVTNAGMNRFNSNPSGAADQTVQFITTKRAIPTSTLYSTVTGAAINVRDFSGNADRAVSFSNPGTCSVSFQMSSISSANGRHGFHWTAEAEL